MKMRSIGFLFLFSPLLGADHRDFLIDHCVDCHEAPKPKGDLSLEKAGAPRENPRLWNRIYDQLLLRQMPPEEKEQPSEKERAALLKWIKEELTQSGNPPEDILARPGYGNHVPHDQLFGDTEATPAFSRPRLWRIRPAVYEGRMRKIDSRAAFVKPFTLSRSHGFADYDQSHRLAGADLTQLMANAKLAAVLLADYREEKGKVNRGKRTPNEIFELIKPDRATPSDEEITTAINWLYQRTLLREPRMDEVAALLKFCRTSVEADGRLLGVRNLVMAILLKPEALYRSERGEGEPDAHGRIKLGNREAAYSLAYALTDSPPDDALLKAAAGSDFDFEKEAKKLLEKPGVEKGRIRDFFREYFEYDGAADVFKDEQLFPAHSPRALIRDTDELVLYLYRQDREVLRNLLTTNLSFVQFEYDRKGEPVKGQARPGGAHLAYHLPPDWKWIPDQPIALPGKQRSGILTQPSWLVAKSGNFDNDAIRRGLWVRRKLLGDTLPDLPITVDAQLPEDPHKTLRQRMEVTREDYCWRCHKKMNPLGEAFEMFDHFGRWRTRELGRPVDSSGAIGGAQDQKLNGDVTDAVAMLQRLAESEHVRQVFLRHVFRFFMGRNETIDDAATLRAMDRSYVDSKGSMKQALLALLTSDSFLYRKAVE